MIKTIQSKEEFETIMTDEPATLFYFSHAQCNVCKVLKPKIEAMRDAHFPNMGMVYVDTVQFPEITAQLSIFAVPTVLVYLDNREFIRKSRNMGIAELTQEIERPYHLMFT